MGLLSILKMFNLTTFAYLDPGSGSVILQVIIASLVGIGFALRGYWGKIKKLFGNQTNSDEIDELDNFDDE